MSLPIEEYKKQVYKWATVPNQIKNLDLARALMGLIAELDEFYQSIEENEDQYETVSEASDCVFWLTQLTNLDDRFNPIFNEEILSDLNKPLTREEIIFICDTVEKLTRKDVWLDEIFVKLNDVLNKQFNSVVKLSGKNYSDLIQINYDKLSVRRKPGKVIDINFI